MYRIKLNSEYDDLDKYKNDYDDIWYCKKNTNITHNPYGVAFIDKYGTKFYFIDGNLHRLDGAAVIRANGEEAYYINNEMLSKEKFEIHPERLKFLGKEHLICLT